MTFIKTEKLKTNKNECKDFFEVTNHLTANKSDSIHLKTALLEDSTLEQDSDG